MFIHILSEEQRSLLEALRDTNLYSGKFYLAGGTAAALYLGHRLSEDFDFFSREEFRQEEVISLSYFEDAEAEPDPFMLKKVDWERIKQFFSEEEARLFELFCK